jgi:hypothetical protein
VEHQRTELMGLGRRLQDFSARDAKMQPKPVLRKLTPSRLLGTITKIEGQPAAIQIAMTMLAMPENQHARPTGMRAHLERKEEFERAL